MLTIYEVMFYLILSQKVSEYVTIYYNGFQTPELLYHNLNHTASVVQRTYEIAADYTFEEEELFILSSAAWFHDIGHLFGKPAQHEARSISVMREFLEGLQVKKEIIDSIEGCIKATELPQQPKTLLEEIICDADTYHLGTEEFLYTDKALKQEFELKNQTTYENWAELTLDVLETHKYFTPYCRSLLIKGKEKNISMVRQMLNNSAD